VFALNSYENRVYQVGLESADPIIVKFYRPGRWTRAQILEEHAFASELASHEIPVIAPLQLAGSSLNEFDGFKLAVFPRCSGRAPELDNPDNLLVMGRFVARIHAIGALKNFEHRRQMDLDSFAIQSREYLLQHDFLPEDVRPAYESLSADLIAAMEQRLKDFGQMKQLRIHGDCHPGNVLWNDETPQFVDFDDTLTGPAIQDLWMMLSGDRNQRQAQLLEIVDGYNEFHDFPTRELVLIETLRTFRLMHYSAWLARRWEDPAFPLSFPWFNTPRYWSEHILELREQLSALDEPPLQLF
jgi:Ser/Thr protein kinase RdoA (MazF antagonist)